MESIRGYDQWLTTPPDDDPICEGEHGCGEVLIRTPFSDGWFCNNEFCPEKFQSTEQRMAEALVDALEEIRTLKAKLTRMTLENVRLVEAMSNSGLE